jgi:hypothetical protein
MRRDPLEVDTVQRGLKQSNMGQAPLRQRMTGGDIFLREKQHTTHTLLAGTNDEPAWCFYGTRVEDGLKDRRGMARGGG